MTTRYNRNLSPSTPPVIPLCLIKCSRPPAVELAQMEAPSLIGCETLTCALSARLKRLETYPPRSWMVFYLN